MRITVLGAGPWHHGAALVPKRQDTLMWSRDPRIVEEFSFRHQTRCTFPGSPCARPSREGRGHRHRHHAAGDHPARAAARLHQRVIGCELGGAVKNVVAIGAGMAQGLGVGTTPGPRASPGLAELAQRGQALGVRRPRSPG
ncbi:hypothetical protein [Nonomuraea sp. NPDC049504]|uniref:hypothetical protein n=1 Tax=Nonomuraea sp. NPDC049504 TaxID=3154729 RepID=UPI0034271F2B